MDRVRKDDIALYKNDNNVVAIRGAYGWILRIFLVIAALFEAMTLIFLYGEGRHRAHKISSNVEAAIIFGILLTAVVIAATVRLIMVMRPRIYFVGGDMYILENKDYYLKILPEELNGYSWKTYVVSGKGSPRYDTAYWGKVNLIINDATYSLSVSSMKKTKHYVDGFKKGLSVIENQFDGDKYQSDSRKLTLTMIAWGIIFIPSTILTFFGPNNAITIIAIILFSFSLLMILVLIIYACVKGKESMRLASDCYDTFLLNGKVNFNNQDDMIDVNDEIENVYDDDN